MNFTKNVIYNLKFKKLIERDLYRLQQTSNKMALAKNAIYFSGVWLKPIFLPN